MPLVCGQQIPILPEIIFLLRAQTAASRSTIRPWGRCRSTLLLGPRNVENICPVPNHLLQFVGSRPVVGEEAALVPAHRQVVDQERAGCSLVFGWIKGALERLEERCDVPVEITDFARDGPHEFCLVRREMSEVLRPLGVLDLWMGRRGVSWAPRAVRQTPLDGRDSQVCFRDHHTSASWRFICVSIRKLCSLRDLFIGVFSVLGTCWRREGELGVVAR
jgi:hypothetical protein